MKLDNFLTELEKDPEYIAAQNELRPILDIANEVLHQRLARGWSQSELARRAGTKQANISRLESGLLNPSIKFLQKIGEAFGIELIVKFGEITTTSINSSSTNPSEFNLHHYCHAPILASTVS